MRSVAELQGGLPGRATGDCIDHVWRRSVTGGARWTWLGSQLAREDHVGSTDRKPHVRRSDIIDPNEAMEVSQRRRQEFDMFRDSMFVDLADLVADTSKL